MSNRPDVTFPSDNEFDIPTLDVALQPTALQVPLMVWGSVSRKLRARGTWCFYCDDYRFDGLWSNPDAVSDTGADSFVEPNFTVLEQDPRAARIWATYRKRWLARFWQMRGMSVWVDLCVGDHALNLLGVPKGWRAYATRGYASRIADLDLEYEVASKHCGGEPLFLVYAGGEPVWEWCRAHRAIHVSDRSAALPRPGQGTRARLAREFEQ